MDSSCYLIPDVGEWTHYHAILSLTSVNGLIIMLLKLSMFTIPLIKLSITLTKPEDIENRV